MPAPRLPHGQGESGWCSVRTSTPEARGHAGVRFLLFGESCCTSLAPSCNAPLTRHGNSVADLASAVWRDDSASDPRSEGWEFASLRGHLSSPWPITAPSNPLGVSRCGRVVPAPGPHAQQLRFKSPWRRLPGVSRCGRAVPAPGPHAQQLRFKSPWRRLPGTASLAPLLLIGLLWELSPGPPAP